MSLIAKSSALISSSAWAYLRVRYGAPFSTLRLRSVAIGSSSNKA